MGVLTTAIQWTDETWNPVTGCSRVSEGCRHCYIERTPPFRMSGRKLGDPVQLHHDRLDAPLSWRKPRRVFVNSLSDLFHEEVPVNFLDKVFGVMASEEAGQHAFQVLTKRPRRMLDYTQRFARQGIKFGDLFPQVWLGVSVENQQTADERIPILLQTPAAVRWVSVEPLLGPVQLGCGGEFYDYGVASKQDNEPRIHWVVVGGESGAKARPCNLVWIRSVVEQCQRAGVSCFVKQLGSNPVQFPLTNETFCDGTFPRSRFKDKKAGDPSEWPPDLRVREWPR